MENLLIVKKPQTIEDYEQARKFIENQFSMIEAGLIRLNLDSELIESLIDSKFSLLGYCDAEISHYYNIRKKEYNRALFIEGNLN